MEKKRNYSEEKSLKSKMSIEEVYEEREREREREREKEKVREKY